MVTNKREGESHGEEIRSALNVSTNGKRKTPHAAAQLHQTYLEAIREQTSPALVLASILQEKLHKQGIDASAHYEYLKNVAAQLLATPPFADQSSFQLPIDDGLEEDRILHIHLDASDFDATAAKITEAIEAASLELFKTLSEEVLREVLTNPTEQLLYLLTEREAFTRRIEHTWAKAFKLLDVQVALCAEIGETRNEWLRRLRRRSKDLVVIDVVTRLHGRAVQIAGEVQALLRNGFADGALSRWRTIHELTVTAMFIADKGVSVAERYLAHLDVDSIKAGRQYHRFASSLGHRQLSKREQKRLDSLARDLEHKYGKSFLGDYGWAADALGSANPNFANIEASVDLDKIRPYVRLASNTVHAGAKGTFFRLGLLNDNDVILAGASNVGLDEGGRLTALTLAQITTVLLLLHPNTDSIVWSRVVLALSLKVEQQFVKTQRGIEREERRLRTS